MTPNHWREIEACYHAALECPDPSARTEYLARLAPEVRKEVEELLAQDSAESPLDHRSGLFEALTPGAMLGHYRVEAAINAGGMGELYRATDIKMTLLEALRF
jgi:hypothetical protein